MLTLGEASSSPRSQRLGRCCTPTYPPETLVDFGALLVGAAAVAFYTLMLVWTVGLVLYEVLLSA